jgi:hypothetical protein
MTTVTLKVGGSPIGSLEVNAQDLSEVIERFPWRHDALDIKRRDLEFAGWCLPADELATADELEQLWDSCMLWALCAVAEDDEADIGAQYAGAVDALAVDITVEPNGDWQIKFTPELPALS